MSPENIVVGRRYVIDAAPLVASPFSAGSTFIGEVLRKDRGSRPYVAPEFGSPLYISEHWFIKEVQHEAA